MALSSQEVRKLVVSRIEAELSKGRVPWQRPWVGDANAPRNLQSGRAYRGINALMLPLMGYSDPRWTTYNGMKQTSKAERIEVKGGREVWKGGGYVRKGEKGTILTLWKRRKIQDADAENGYRIIPMLRYFHVFNVEQIEWPEGTLPELSTDPLPDFNPIEAGEETLTSYLDSDSALRLTWGGILAYYMPSEHRINLPDREAFKTPEGFYGTAFHECAHSTGPELGRAVANSFGSDKYSREELVAEMTAAFICAELGIAVPYENSASYIAGWMGAIQNDENLVIKAAGQAQKAADRIFGRVMAEPDTAEVAVEPEKELSHA